jgi:hypothetical protein
MTNTIKINGLKITSIFEKGALIRGRIFTDTRIVEISKNNKSDLWSISLERRTTCEIYGEVTYSNLRFYIDKTWDEAITYFDKKMIELASK